MVAKEQGGSDSGEAKEWSDDTGGKKWQVGHKVEVLRTSSEWVFAKIMDVEADAVRVTLGDTDRFQKSIRGRLRGTYLRPVDKG